MPMHSDFVKIYKRFINQYGENRGKEWYYAWLKKHDYDDTKPFPKHKEKKELKCKVIGFEIKELPDSYHIEGLIATSHIDNLDMMEGIEISDMIPKETLISFAEQINTRPEARIMGVHHSEGKPINAEYYGVADIENYPAKVIELSDGNWGLYVDTKLLKSDPKVPEIIKKFETGDLTSFSITYDTDGFSTTEFDWVEDKLVRILNPDTKLFGYTAASDPVNPNAIATNYGYKEFKEMVKKEIEKNDNKKYKEQKEKEDIETMAEEIKPDIEPVSEEKPEPVAEPVEEKKEEAKGLDESEKKEFEKLKTEQKEREEKEKVEKTANKIAERVLEKMELKEKVLKDNAPSNEASEVALEYKEFVEVVKNPDKLELKEQFRRAAAVCDARNIDWKSAITSPAESREFKNFGVRGRQLEFKGLSLTTNQNSDTDYLQSAAELQDVYDPVIYNALNQATVTWNVLAKDDFSSKGNNQIQFTLKTAANASATFYNGNSVATDNVTRLKFQTKFKKLQVGVSVDGDMIAAARGGPVSDVFAQEVLDSTQDMLAVLNAALYAEVGLETAAAVIGFEFITDSASNTTMYSLTRSSTNKLSPDSAGDTYINQSSAVISMTNLRAAIRQAKNEGANKANLVLFTNPVQGDMLRGKFDDSRRLLSPRDTTFGFSTDLFVDGVPVFEDKDCNTDDWFLVDLETHRVGIWIPPTIEKLDKSSDSEAAFIKTYLGVYNRAPRRMVQIYGCATS